MDVFEGIWIQVGQVKQTKENHKKTEKEIEGGKRGG